MFAAKRIPQFLLPGLCLISSSCVSLTSGDPNQIKTAISVPHLTLYVRSPYTSPAQLVKIENVSADGTMICPYTKRPFYVPGYARKKRAVPDQETALVSNEIKPRMKRDAASKPEKDEGEVTILHQSRADDVNTLRKRQVVDETSAPALPSMLEPRLDDATSASSVVETSAASVDSKLPYGIRVAGQKDFVRSPFAAAHQLVDVAGMPVGSEVKCPYSGKLFRVPAPE